MNDSILTALPAQPREMIPDVLPAEPLVEVLPAQDGLSPFEPLTSLWWLIGTVSEWLFGAFALVLGLSILSVIPVVQLLSLGYLLEVSGRIARSGRLRDGFIGVRRAARVGSILLGIGLMWLLLNIPASFKLSAEVIDPGGPQSRFWQLGLTVLAGLMYAHIVAACARGGKLRYFFWPFNFIWVLRRFWRGGYYSEARDAVWDFVSSLRLPYYFSLGLRGFIGTFAWIAVPITLMGLGSKIPPVGFLGAFLFMFVLLYVPFLQVRFARDNRLRAHFEFFAVRRDFRRAPVAFAFVFFVTLLFALPLYLFKIELIPRETMFLESLVFLAFIVPARLLTGWAFGRATKRATPRHWFFRWTSRLTMLPVVFFYVFLLYFTQYIAWGGVSSLYEQHAFLLPTPFLGWK